jgi:hypothetical protein
MRTRIYLFDWRGNTTEARWLASIELHLGANLVQFAASGNFRQASLNFPDPSEDSVIFVHCEKMEKWYDFAERSPNPRWRFIRLYTEGGNGGGPPLFRSCPHTPKSFERSVRVAQFFRTLKEGGQIDLELLFGHHLPTIEALCILTEPSVSNHLEGTAWKDILSTSFKDNLQREIEYLRTFSAALNGFPILESFGTHVASYPDGDFLEMIVRSGTSLSSVHGTIRAMLTQI